MRTTRFTTSTWRDSATALTRWIAAVGLLGTLAACNEAPISPLTDLADELSPTTALWTGDPVFRSGNPTCTGLGYLGGYKVDSPAIGSPVTIGPITFTFTDTKNLGSWSSTIPIDAIIMKAGNGALIFSYAGGASSGGGEYTPTNSGGVQAAISHIELCYYGRFGASIEGAGLYTRDFDWAIAKAASAPASIATGSPLLVDYTVTTTRDSTDRDFMIDGSVTVLNSGYGVSGVVLGVDADIGGLAADIDCGSITFPKTMADGESFTCDYSLIVPDATSRLETWTVTVDETGGWRSTSFEDLVVFGEPTTLIDDVVTLFDTRVPAGLGTFTAPGEVLYSVTYGPYTACVPVLIENIASFVTDDNEETGADTASVTVDVTGCSSGGDAIGTAFAYSGNPATAFSALGLATRWGWTINFGGPGSHTYDVYVGAGQNDLSKGTLVGTVTITYTGSTVTATYNLLPGYSILEEHLYAGSTQAPMRVSGKKTVPTVAPGQYTVNVSGGSIWVIAHSVIGYTQP